MPVRRFMLGVRFDDVHDRLRRRGAHLEGRHFDGGHRGLQHSPRPVAAFQKAIIPGIMKFFA